jgi:hypothetical protein
MAPRKKYATMLEPYTQLTAVFSFPTLTRRSSSIYASLRIRKASVSNVELFSNWKTSRVKADPGHRRLAAVMHVYSGAVFLVRNAEWSPCKQFAGNEAL